MHNYISPAAILIAVIFVSASLQAQKKTNDFPDRQWWKEAVVYQLYPRSFKDSDGDGISCIELFQESGQAT